MYLQVIKPHIKAPAGYVCIQVIKAHTKAPAAEIAVAIGKDQRDKQ
jgi:hypothetical protein